MPVPVPVSPAAAPLVLAFLSRLALAPPQGHGALTVWPLLPSAPGPDAPAYRTLRQAEAAGALAVEELRGGATVPHVLVENRGDVPVLVLFGEQLAGALQHRTVNASFLVPAHAQLALDVSCIEAGRWSGRRSFQGTSEVLAHALRRKMAKAVTLARKRGGRFAADQGEVWSDIEERLAGGGVRSESFSYRDYVARWRDEMGEAVAAFRPVPGQVGFVAAIGGEVVGLEAIGRPEVFAEAFPGLLDAYVVDALEAARAGAPRPAPRFPQPEGFLAALAAAPAEEGASLGLGQDVRLADERVHACALVAGDVVHLTAFAEVAA